VIDTVILQNLQHITPLGSVPIFL